MEKIVPDTLNTESLLIYALLLCALEEYSEEDEIIDEFKKETVQKLREETLKRIKRGENVPREYFDEIKHHTI